MESENKYPFIILNLHSGRGGIWLDGHNIEVFYECPMGTKMEDWTTLFFAVEDEVIKWVNDNTNFIKSKGTVPYDVRSVGFQLLEEEKAQLARDTIYYFNI